MGFCRRCGDIVTGARCHCGGTAVGMLQVNLSNKYSNHFKFLLAPVFSWNYEKKPTESQDSWSKTYVSVKKSNSQTLSPSSSTSTYVPNTTTPRRFPRPK